MGETEHNIRIRRKKASASAQPSPDERVYTVEEVRHRLLYIRDRAIDWLYDCSTQRITQGVGAACMILARAGDEMARLDGTVSAGGVFEIRVNGFDLSQLEFGKRQARAEAAKSDTN